MDTSLLGEHELGRFQVVEHVYLCWPWFNQWGGRNQNKTHKLNRKIGGSAIPLSGFELGNEYDWDAIGLKDIPGDIVGRKDIPGDIGVLKDVAGDIVGDAGYAVE